MNLPFPTAEPMTFASPHLSVYHFHSSAVTHSQNPRVGGEVCPAPRRRVPKHKGLRILVDLPKPWGDMGGEMSRWGWEQVRGNLALGPGHTVCEAWAAVQGELFVDGRFSGKGTLPVVRCPQTDGSRAAADNQLPGQVRAIGQKCD